MKSDTPSRLQGSARTDELIEYRFFPIAEVAQITGLGRDTMTALIDLGAPVVARKMNLPMLFQWMSENSDKLRDLKVRS